MMPMRQKRSRKKQSRNTKQSLLPEFEKADRFKRNIVNCAMIGAFILSTPALCRLDYTMSEAGGATDFVRQYTLASGGPYCDCGYKKKGFVKGGMETGR